MRLNNLTKFNWFLFMSIFFMLTDNTVSNGKLCSSIFMKKIMFNPLFAEFVLREHKHVFPCYVIPPHWNGTYVWNPSWWKVECCWWPGNTRSQGISSHGIDLVCLESSGPHMVRVKRFLCLKKMLNSLWPSDAIVWHRSWSTLAQIMPYCLMH